MHTKIKENNKILETYNIKEINTIQINQLT